MYRFRSLFSKPGRCYNSNGIFEEDFFRRRLHFLWKREGFTKGQQYLKETSFHWHHDYLNCNSYGSFKNSALTHHTNFIIKRPVHQINTQSLKNNAEKGSENTGQNSIPSNEISKGSIPQKWPPFVKNRNRAAPILSVEPSFNILLKNVLSDIDKSMCNFDSNESDDTLLYDEMNEDVNLKEDFNSSCDVRHQTCDFDIDLLINFLKVSERRSVMKVRDFTQRLPCFKFKDDFLDLVEKNQVLLVTGSTGSGKSSQLVQYVLNDFILSLKGSSCNIVCVVPRRICAISLAERVAEERGETVGRSIGYQIQFHKFLSRLKGGCINFMTPGIFLLYMRDKDFINKLSHIFIDEIHERSIECDLILALMKKIMPEKPELKIVLLSATTNVDLFTTYMNGAPHLEIQGSAYPVEEHYLEDVLEKTKYEFKKKKIKETDEIFYDKVLPYVNEIEENGSYPKCVTHEMKMPQSEEINNEFITRTLQYIIENEDVGCILIFLPGLQNIFRLKDHITLQPWYSKTKHQILPMHSIISAEEQKRIFIPSLKNCWKIIISTSILETSVTVEEIKYIIDCGKIKVSRYDVNNKITSVVEEWISRTNAIQRRGRAGRVQQGKCFKLYSKAREESFSKFPEPELLRSNLEETYLKVKALNIGCAKSFLNEVIDPPNENLVLYGIQRLKEIGVLDVEGELTPLGENVTKLPVSVQIGKLLLMGAVFRCADPISSIAAYLSLKSPFITYSEKTNDSNSIKKWFDRGDISDHLILSRVMNEWEETGDQDGFCSDNMLSQRAMLAISCLKRQLGRVLYDLNFLSFEELKHPSNNLNSENTKVVKAVLCAGLYPNYAVVRNQKKSKKTQLKSVESEHVFFHSKSYCNKLKDFESPFFVYYDQIMSQMAFIHDATMVDVLPMILFARSVSTRQESFHCIINVKNLISVRIPAEVACQLMDMRKHLELIFNQALRNPKILSLLHENIIPSIVQLLSSETSVTWE